MAKILSKFGEEQLVMVNYACGFNQSETEKYFEWIVIKIKHNSAKNLNWPEANYSSWLFTSVAEELKLGVQWNKSRQWPELSNSNPEPLDCKSDKLTTRPRCLHTSGVG